MRRGFRSSLACWLLFAALPGCAFLPKLSRQPALQNPFPQLSRVAIAPFFNLSAEPTVDGRQFAIGYFNELQNVPGFEVVPVGVVEQAMKSHNLTLADPLEARKLAQILKVDAVVIGAVTEFNPYYPPRIAMQVEWYAANPCLHPIPAGYGLPWGTTMEEEIPDELVYEAEMALAREQMKTQTPLFAPLPLDEPKPLPIEADGAADNIPDESSTIRHLSGEQPIDAPAGGEACPTGTTGTASFEETGLPHNWPDPRGFAPPPPQANCPTCVETHEPVMRHTNIYLGNDAQVTSALQTYVYFQDDARFGGWQTYLQRSDDFIQFCCHMHIAEMLSARGGGGETRVVWRWPVSR